ncbi:MAG: hypothetical protein ABII13_03450 [Patescibacteria group bacterium]|nr:hypothetical protein [Patescibacteria group bacterium]MBU2509451.1 hypothetical protein [Patescibacteria group bacterium]
MTNENPVSETPTIPETHIESTERPNFTLDVDPTFEGFQSVEVTKIDDSKPWKPAMEVKVTNGDGTVVEGVDANRAVYTFKDSKDQSIIVSIATAGHIDDLHIHAKEPGSKFEQASLTELMQDISKHLPEDVMDRKGISTFDMEMGKHMGLEGIASMDELMEAGVLTPQDIASARMEKDHVFELNKSGSMDEKEAYIESYRAAHPENKIQFQFVRDTVVVPVVNSPKLPTTKLFMMMGPDSNEKLSMFTIAPGRDMPRHPNPGQHTDQEGKFDEETFKQSADAWFDNPMLIG